MSLSSVIKLIDYVLCVSLVYYHAISRCESGKMCVVRSAYIVNLIFMSVLYVQSPCCGKVYKCRVCHDEQEFHKIDRFKVKEVICRTCSTRQPVRNVYHQMISLFSY